MGYMIWSNHHSSSPWSFHDPPSSLGPLFSHQAGRSFCCTKTRGLAQLFFSALGVQNICHPFCPSFWAAKCGQKRVGHGDTAIFSYLFQLLTAPMAWQTFIFGGDLSSHILLAGQDTPPKRCKKNQVPGHWLPSALKLCLSNVFAQLGYVLRGLGTGIGYQKRSPLISLSAFLSRLVFFLFWQKYFRFCGCFPRSDGSRFFLWGHLSGVCKCMFVFQNESASWDKKLIDTLYLFMMKT